MAGRYVPWLGGLVASVPDAELTGSPRRPASRGDQPRSAVRGTLERTGAATGARWVTENLGVDGAGVGVAIIDSGVTRGTTIWAGASCTSSTSSISSRSRTTATVTAPTSPGIIAGSGHDSDGARRGIAPGAHLIVLKALDDSGQRVHQQRHRGDRLRDRQPDVYNIRVINLSVAAGVYESYKTDPLTLAAKRAVDAGIVVVTAAGNLGRNDTGQPQFGGITSPGNAPWVLTVGAASHNGTVDRRDDSSPPSVRAARVGSIWSAKPDLVAPGVGIESLPIRRARCSSRGRRRGCGARRRPASEPYLSLSGTSMAAPVSPGPSR